MNIKELRKAAGLTQVQLAELMGVKQSTVSGWESGNYWPSAQILPALAEALHCSVGDLYAKEAAG